MVLFEDLFLCSRLLLEPAEGQSGTKETKKEIDCRTFQAMVGTDTVQWIISGEKQCIMGINSLKVALSCSQSGLKRHGLVILLHTPSTARDQLQLL